MSQRGKKNTAQHSDLRRVKENSQFKKGSSKQGGLGAAFVKVFTVC